MTAVQDSAAPWASPTVPSVPALPAARFHGDEGRFFWLLVRGSLLLAITLGLYRFWLTTDVRRFLWGSTEIAGDNLEYSGTARELLIGFLMALALMTPIYALFFLAALDMGMLGAISGILAFLLLALLGQFAVFRARRYRLTRTIFRGLRLHQTGSAWAYAFLSMVWMGLTIVTLGLAHPFSVASLERYKMRRTHFGTLQGAFAGSGTRLFFRGLLLWLLVAAPMLAGLASAVLLIDWSAILAALVAGGEDVLARLAAASPDLVGAIALSASGIGGSVLLAFLLYPAYRAMVMRWWLSGVRLGPVHATSRLRTASVYRVYLRFIVFTMLFGMGLSVVAGVLFSVFGPVFAGFFESSASELTGTAAALVAYVVAMLGYSAIYQATVTIRMWRLSFETTELGGLDALDGVEARGAAGSPFGEGLADALDVGGL